jgi:hypothetical protein
MISESFSGSFRSSSLRGTTGGSVCCCDGGSGSGGGERGSKLNDGSKDSREFGGGLTARGFGEAGLGVGDGGFGDGEAVGGGEGGIGGGEGGIGGKGEENSGEGIPAGGAGKSIVGSVRGAANLGEVRRGTRAIENGLLEGRGGKVCGRRPASAGVSSTKPTEPGIFFEEFPPP